MDRRSKRNPSVKPPADLVARYERAQKKAERRPDSIWAQLAKQYQQQILSYSEKEQNDGE